MPKTEVLPSENILPYENLSECVHETS